MKQAYIKAIAHYLPEQVYTNEQLIAEFPEWSVDKIVKKVGVHSRHISAPDETASDMGIKAAQRLFDEQNIDPKDIDFVLFCSQSTDYYMPTTAGVIQHKLGIPISAGAFDYNLACSGYIYGLSVAKGLIAADIAHNILLITSDTYSKFIYGPDKGSRSIFGDGAAATIVSTEGFAEIGNPVLGTDGAGAEHMIIQTGGARRRKPIGKNRVGGPGEGNTMPDYFYMNGSEVFNFALETVPPLIEKTLISNGLQMSDIDYVVMHQASKFILDTLRKLLGFSKDKYYINMAETGNTVASTIPIALCDVLQRGVLTSGMRVLMAAFGVGYSWGATVLKIDF